MLSLLRGGERITIWQHFQLNQCNSQCTFIPGKLLKHSRRGFFHRPVTYTNHLDYIKLCPVTLITKYIKR